MSAKTRLINALIAREGGFVDDPDDSGGATNYGITAEVAWYYGYKGLMRDLPRDLAVNIYHVRYWDTLNLDNIESIVSPRIVEELLDTAVNMGVSRAARFLQRSLNVLNDRGNLYPDLTVDGKIGMRTINALQAYTRYRKEPGSEILLRMLNALQGAFYVELAERREKDEAFIYGWFLNRVGM
jgi:lysozyme family protein